jgi:S-adenosylmethionine:tRNA ribosyltransferase-isomerase
MKYGNKVHIADFDYHLPQELIATRPVVPRDSSRLLVVGGEQTDLHVRDLPQLLRAGDLLVFNDTRVIPARLMARLGEKKVEVLLHRSLGDGRWEVFAKPAKKLNAGDTLHIADDFGARVISKDPELGSVILDFDLAGPAFWQKLSAHGSMPVPPYFKRGGDQQDITDYQTMFAAREGAVAAPTASLHFTPQLMADLEKVGVEHEKVTLHVGAGTFAPVRTDNIDDHIMHSEWCEISRQTADKITAVKKATTGDP